VRVDLREMGGSGQLDNWLLLRPPRVSSCLVRAPGHERNLWMKLIGRSEGLMTLSGTCQGTNGSFSLPSFRPRLLQGSDAERIHNI